MSLNQSDWIRVEQVSRKFASATVLDHIELAISQGEIFGLLGPSGSGKTTLIKLIAGIDIPSEGSVTVMNTQMPSLAMLGSIGYMAQADALYNELTAKENLQFFGALYGLKGKALQERIKSVMELVGLQDAMNKLVANYSGGMKRRLSLAIALIHEPPTLILDEPTVGIDPVLRQSIWQELEEISRQGTTIIVTTHVMDEAERCDRLGMIRAGQLIAIGTPAELKAKTNSQTLEGAFLVYGGETA